MIAATEQATDNQVRLIPIRRLIESQWNPRQVYPEKQMAELAASMRENGFRTWLPIVVRPVPNLEFADINYEIAAGHRRRRAALEAGITEVPCLVREMSDSEFLDVLNFDNSQREDVHPLHEAAGWRAWMERTGLGVADIAKRIGQSKEYVYQRLKYESLIAPASQAFLDGKLSAGHAVLIARLAPEDQKAALRHCEPPASDPDKVPSVRDLVAWIKARSAEAPAAEAAPEPVAQANAAPAPEPRQPAEKPQPQQPVPGIASTTVSEAGAEDEADRLQRVMRAEAEAALRRKILAAMLARVKWPPQRKEIVEVAMDMLWGMVPAAYELAGVTGFHPGLTRPDAEALLNNLTAVQLAKLIVVSACEPELAGWGEAEHLYATARRYGVDPIKVRAEIQGGTRKEADGEGKAKAKPATAAKKKTPAAKKKKLGMAAQVTKAIAASAPVSKKKAGKQ